MSVRPHIDAALARSRSLLGRLAFLPPLATRITIGLGYWHTGTGKWHNFERTVQFFASVGIPFARANAAFISWLEIVGGLLLVAGLATRASALLLAGSMTVALLTADRADFVASWGSASESSPTDVASFVFLLFLLWLIVHGAGPVSVDRVVARLRSRIVPAAPAGETGEGSGAKKGTR